MSKQNYLLTEKGSNIVFAVISQVNGFASLKNIELINKVGQAVEDEFCYEDKVKVVHNTFKETNGTIFIDFRGLDDCGDEEIREFELNLTAIY